MSALTSAPLPAGFLDAVKAMPKKFKRVDGSVVCTDSVAGYYYNIGIPVVAASDKAVKIDLDGNGWNFVWVPKSHAYIVDNMLVGVTFYMANLKGIPFMGSFAHRVPTAY